MQIIERIKKAINAYVRNDAKAAAIASVLTNKDCTSKDLVEMSGFDKAALGILPLINKENISFDSGQLMETISRIFSHNAQGRILFLLCGPSGAGKDTLASYAKQSLYFERTAFSYVRKYTTRSRRGYEGSHSSGSYSEPSGNYEYFKDKGDMLRAKQDLSLGYSIYDHYYAFSGSHLISNEFNDRNLMCIYGRFENIHSVRSDVFFKHKRIPFSILITAPSEDLEGRILRRHSLSESEQGKRIKEMRRQLNFIKKNPELISSGFDIVIENGDITPVNLGHLKLTDFIRNSMEFGNKFVTADG